MIALAEHPVKSTAPQRWFIARLMARLELPTRRTCLLHRRHFEAAGLPAPAPDRCLDEILHALTETQANALIDALKREVSEVS